MKKFEHSLSLLSWAYNEEDSIEEFLNKANNLLESTVDDYEIILIDDGSTDKTYDIAKRYQKINSKIKISQNEKNLNIGLSMCKAIQMASKEFLFWQTVDWSYDLSNLRSFVENLKRYDIVQGVRWKSVETKIDYLQPIAEIPLLFSKNHIRKRSDNPQKAIVSILNYIVLRLLFRVPISDFQNISFYRTSWIKSIQYESRSAFTNPEGLIKSFWQNKSVKEVPINFIPRIKGKGNGNSPLALFSAIVDIIRLYIKWTCGKNVFLKKGKIERL